MSGKKQNTKGKQQAEGPVGPAQVGAPSGDLSEANQHIEALTNDLQRIQAEFINFKSRSEEEKATLSQFSKAQVIKDLLPVIDDLERALAHQPNDLKDNKWAQGVASIHARLLKQLDKLGVRVLSALDKPFDPNLHDAVHVEGEGSTQVVSEVVQNGYIMGDQVIRHAVVKVKNVD